MSTQAFEIAQAPIATGVRERDKRYLFGPIVDFLCLGGSSLIILPLLLLLPVETYKAQLAAVMLLVAHAINHPHFASSYQIFYRGFVGKAFGDVVSPQMRIRYIVSGIVVPVALLAFVGFCLIRKDAQLLGYGGNAMGLFVGWHYVKQGYGMLMVDAALKKQFFKEPEKKLLVVNCYTVWIAAWVSVNAAISQQDLWGLKYYSFAFPSYLVLAAQGAALVSSAVAAVLLYRRWSKTGGLPLNGVIAYVVSLYIWLLFIRINPLWGLVVPALHSIQYLVVVSRFETNYETAKLQDPDYKRGSLARQLLGSNPLGHLALFALTAATLGFMGFWGLPLLMQAWMPQGPVFGAGLFLFVFWIFINVHHYFLDTVMWRRENPDTKKFLFS